MSPRELPTGPNNRPIDLEKDGPSKEDRDRYGGNPEQKSRAKYGIRSEAYEEKGGGHEECEDRTLLRNDLRIWGVFDGLGGHTAGAEAATIARDTVTSFYEELLHTGNGEDKLADPEIQASIARAALQNANQQILEIQDSDPDKSDMATTATVVHAFRNAEDKPMLAFAHAGDTQLHLLRHGRMLPITHDEGQGSSLSNCLGRQDLKIRQSGAVELKFGDRILLISDGISGDTPAEKLSDVDYERALSRKKTLSRSVKDLVAVSKKDDDKAVVLLELYDQNAKPAVKERLGKLATRTTEMTKSAVTEARLKGKNTFTKVRELVKSVSFGGAEENANNETVEKSPAQRLDEARMRLAEQKVKVRRGKLIGQRKAEEKQSVLATEYQEAMQAYLKSELANHPEIETMSKAEREALAAELAIKASGRLVGEEVQYYMQLENGKYARFLSWYGRQSTAKKLGLGLLAGATAGVLGAAAGAIGAGGAAAAGAAGVRFSRGHANKRGASSAANIAPDTTELREKYQRYYRNAPHAVSYDEYRRQVGALEQSSHHHFNQAYYEQELQSPYNLVEKGEKKIGEAYTHEDDARVLSERVAAQILNSEDAYALEGWRKRDEKVKAVGAGVGALALGAVAGYLIEGLVDGFDADTDVEGDTPEVEPTETDAPVESDGGGDAEGEPDGAEDEPDEAENDEPEDVPTDPEGDNGDSNEAEISERSQYLYGELAGQEIDITIPEGSTVWDELEAAVEKEVPGVSDSEKQRLVGNILNQLEHEYPSRDFDLVYPGESFSVELPK